MDHVQGPKRGRNERKLKDEQFGDAIAHAIAYHLGT